MAQRRSTISKRVGGTTVTMPVDVIIWWQAVAGVDVGVVVAGQECLYPGKRSGTWLKDTNGVPRT